MIFPNFDTVGTLNWNRIIAYNKKDLVQPLGNIYFAKLSSLTLEVRGKNLNTSSLIKCNIIQSKGVTRYSFNLIRANKPLVSKKITC